MLLVVTARTEISWHLLLDSHRCYSASFRPESSPTAVTWPKHQLCWVCRSDKHIMSVYKPDSLWRQTKTMNVAFRGFWQSSHWFFALGWRRYTYISGFLEIKRWPPSLGHKFVPREWMGPGILDWVPSVQPLPTVSYRIMPFLVLGSHLFNWEIMSLRKWHGQWEVGTSAASLTQESPSTAAEAGMWSSHKASSLTLVSLSPLKI